MSKYTVVVVSLGYESYAIEREILETVDAELVLAPRDCFTEAEVIAAASKADAILVREAPVSARVIDALTRCKAIVRYGVGVDNIDLEHARKRRIYVANIPATAPKRCRTTRRPCCSPASAACARATRICARGASKPTSRSHLPHHRQDAGPHRLRQIGKALHRKWKVFSAAGARVRPYAQRR